MHNSHNTRHTNIMALSEYYKGWGQASDEQLHADIEQSDKYSAEDEAVRVSLIKAVHDVSNAADAAEHHAVVEVVAPKLSRKERLALKRAGPQQQASPLSKSAGTSPVAQQLGEFSHTLKSLKYLHDQIIANDQSLIGPAHLSNSVWQTAHLYDQLLRLAPSQTQAQLSTQVQQETSHTAIKRRHEHSHDEPCAHATSCSSQCDAGHTEGQACSHPKAAEAPGDSPHEPPPTKTTDEMPAATLELLRCSALAARDVHTLALYRLGGRQLRAGQADACMATCRRLLFQHPTFTRAWLLRGKAFACVGALLLAQLHFDRALQLDGFKPGAVELLTPHLENVDFALSTFDLQSVQNSSDTRDDLSGSTVAALPTAPLPAVQPSSLARIHPAQYRQFVGHLLGKCFTSMACKRWLAAALDGTCHWSRADLVHFHSLPWAHTGDPPTTKHAAVDLLPAFMQPALQTVAAEALQCHAPSSLPHCWPRLLFVRRVGRVLFREGFCFSAAAAFEAVAGGTAAVVAVLGSAEDCTAPRVLLAASLLNLAACLMKRRVQLGSAVQACDAAVQQLAAVEAASVGCTSTSSSSPAASSTAGAGAGAGAAAEGGAAASNKLLVASADRFDLTEHEADGVNTSRDAVFRLRIKCMFRKGQCLIDTGEYASGMSALISAQGELQDALAAGGAGRQQLQAMLRPVQRAVLRGKYIAQHSKRMVLR